MRICWVPSHVGIPGNEKADSLANHENSLNSRTSLGNALLISEETSILKLYLKEYNMKELKMSNGKINIQNRVQPDFLKWLLHKSRTITRILFRLRTGHNRLRAQLARHRTRQDPSCQECDAPETTKHALLHCAALEMERLSLISQRKTSA